MWASGVLNFDDKESFGKGANGNGINAGSGNTNTAISQNDTIDKSGNKGNKANKRTGGAAIYNGNGK